MTSGLINFVVYTLAMIGFIFLAFIIAKDSLNIGLPSNRKDEFLSIEGCLNIEPRKNIYLIKAGNEKFLISTDTTGSHFLTKLESQNPLPTDNKEKPEIPDKISAESLMNNIINNKKSNPPIMKKLLEKLDSINLKNEIGV